jgi:hypothetical protein
LLINNAGAIPRGNLTDIDEARWRAAWDHHDRRRRLEPALGALATARRRRMT